MKSSIFHVPIIFSLRAMSDSLLGNTVSQPAPAKPCWRTAPTLYLTWVPAGWAGITPSDHQSLVSPPVSTQLVRHVSSATRVLPMPMPPAPFGQLPSVV